MFSRTALSPVAFLGMLPARRNPPPPGGGPGKSGRRAVLILLGLSITGLIAAPSGASEEFTLSGLQAVIGFLICLGSIFIPLARLRERFDLMLTSHGEDIENLSTKVDGLPEMDALIKRIDGLEKKQEKAAQEKMDALSRDLQESRRREADLRASQVNIPIPKNQ